MKIYAKRFFCLLLFLSFCLPAPAGCEDKRTVLLKGKEALEKGDYGEAITVLEEAGNSFPLLGDYALFWLSDAYHETGQHKESLCAIRKLLEKYPDSPLVKKARMKELEIAAEISEENVQKLYESYILDYPGDNEIKYMYARWLKQDGDTDKAKAVFKEIYVDAGDFSDMAYSELSPSDISVQDKINYAANLIRRMDYKGAEAVLRNMISEDTDTMKRAILKTLGLSLFKQKKYSEAAEIYKEAGEKYWEARSLYRAGKKGEVDSAVKVLIDNGDKRASSILLALAADKRREGDTGAGIRIYQNILEKFPSEREDALWGIGWTYYLSGDYAKASDIFSDLYGTYKEPKYLYWYARSRELAGDDPLNFYPQLTDTLRNFYSAMAYTRSLISLKQNETESERKPAVSLTPVKEALRVPQKIDRVEALFDLDLYKEAVAELIHISRNTNSMEEVFYLCSKFHEIGEYEHLVRLAVRVPYTEEIHGFLYPFAYRSVVEKVSGKYHIDPVLVLSIMREESRFASRARSPAGALGLMQLMPQTAYRCDRKLGLGIRKTADILDIRNNLHIGVYYLSNLIKEFGSYTHAIAAYNAGEENVRRWLRSGNYRSSDEFIEDIPFNETKKYVKRVITTFFEYKRLSAADGDIVEIPLEKL